MTFGNAGELEHRYLYGPAADQVLTDETFKTVGTQRVTDEVLWQLGDQQGTIRDIADDNGVLRKHVDYDSFGNVGYEQYYYQSGDPIESTEPVAVNADAIDQFFFFQGRPWDRDAKLYDFRARPYDAGTGRFLSEDPIFASNLYPLAGNSPTNFTDPTGLTPAGNPLINLFGGTTYNPYAGSLATSSSPIFTQPRPSSSPGLSLGTLGSVLGNSVYNAAASYVAPTTRTLLNTGLTLGAIGATSASPPNHFVANDEGLFSTIFRYIVAPDISFPELSRGAKIDRQLDDIRLHQAQASLAIDPATGLQQVQRARQQKTERFTQDGENLAEGGIQWTATVLSGGFLRPGAAGAGPGIENSASQSYKSFDALKRALGPAGEGRVYHHIVEQSQIGRFGAEAIQNSGNVVSVPVTTNIKLNALYSSIRKEITGSATVTVRQWLSTKSYQEAQDFGAKAVINVQNGTWP